MIINLSFFLNLVEYVLVRLLCASCNEYPKGSVVVVIAANSTFTPCTIMRSQSLSATMGLGYAQIPLTFLNAGTLQIGNSAAIYVRG
jgi:hypothetical protein